MNARAELLGLRQMPAEDYHKVPALSAGGLKRLKQSPAHFYGAQLDPARPPSEPTASMVNGTLVHTLAFEPDEVDRRYVVKPLGLNLSTKGGKEWKEAQTLQIVSHEDMTAARRQAAALRALPDVAALLEQGEAEVSAFWIDPATGAFCKCRPDWVSPAGDGVILVDGKTTTDASPEGFGRAIWNYAYHLQAAHYSAGYELATGKRVLGFVFAVVESSWPHCAAAYMLDDSVMEKARAENLRLAELYVECLRTNTWPGYPRQIQPVNLPAWAMKENTL